MALGFSGLPSGNCYDDGLFDYLGDYGGWWSSSPYEGDATYRSIGSSSIFYRSNNAPQYGYSVRCVKD